MRVLLLLVSLLSWTTAVQAQQSRPSESRKGFALLSAGLHPAVDTFRATEVLRANAEDGQLSTEYELDSGVFLQATAGLRVWKRLGLGIGLTRFSSSGTGQFSASIPHPFFFNRSRAVSEAKEISRSELAIHVPIRVELYRSSKLEMGGFAGPSYVSVQQDMITNYTTNDRYPYDSVILASLTVSPRKTSGTGFHVGTDLSYFFSPSVGIGGSAQYLRSEVAIASLDTSSVKSATGGMQASVGLRLRF